MREEKIAIVTSGGGMKCAYAAGALVALAKKLGFTEPDIFVSASGSVGAMFYFLAHQPEEIEKIWLRYVPSPQIVSLIPPRLNVDYIVDTILRRELPLDIDKLGETKTRWIVPVTDLDTGHTTYVTNETWFDPYEVMRAAKAIPLLYGGAVRLGIQPYIDGGISANMATLIRKAHEAGATKILCLSNTTYTSPGTALFMRGYAAFARPMLRELILKDIRRAEWDHLPGNVEIMVVGPSYPLPTGLFTRTRRKVAETYQMGHDDVIERRAEIEKFLTKKP
ncbi:MAG TPA: patatin-like phospholipase family protein [Candidatus Paceibacterota bacterium]|nr:patatin-like phospholipase family protein [Candidatus Paceibacterota bacterium]